MKNKPTLLILAGGLASRYGAIKQMESVGPSGESILEYSVFDAIREDFEKVVFVLNSAIEKDFKEKYDPLFSKKIRTEYIVQSIDDLPQGFEKPAGRVKPWGTGHAVRASREIINTPFVVINADDFYGRESYSAIRKFIATDNSNYAMYAYKLGNTLSKYGTVSRGVCKTDDGFLTEINENTSIHRTNNNIIKSDQNESLPDDTPVSMNFWFFRPDVFQIIDKLFLDFINKNNQSLTAEFYIPSVVQHVISEKIHPITVLSGNSTWFGMTYKSDREQTRNSINNLIQTNTYPPKLWKQ